MTYARLVLTGAAPPWQGEAGARQQLLGARNACALCASFLAADVEVVITDLLIPDTEVLYRELLPGCLIVRLRAPLSETQRRSASRTRWLTSVEFVALHDHDSAHPPAVDVTIDVTHCDVTQQTAAIERAWASAGLG